MPEKWKKTIDREDGWIGGETFFDRKGLLAPAWNKG